MGNLLRSLIVLGLLFFQTVPAHAEGCGGGGGGGGAGGSGSGGSGGGEQKPPIESNAQSSMNSKAQLGDVAKALQNAGNIGTLNNDAVRANLQAQVNKAAEFHQKMYDDASSGKYDTRGMVGFWKDLAGGLKSFSGGNEAPTPTTENHNKVAAQKGSLGSADLTITKATTPAEAGRALVQMLDSTTQAPLVQDKPLPTITGQTSIVVTGLTSDKTQSSQLKFNDSTPQQKGITSSSSPNETKSFLVGELSNSPSPKVATTAGLELENPPLIREEAERLFDAQLEAAKNNGDTQQVSLLEMVKQDSGMYEKVIETIGEKIAKRFRNYEKLDSTIASLTLNQPPTRRLSSYSDVVEATPWIARTSTRMAFFTLFGGLLLTLTFVHYSDRKE